MASSAFQTTSFSVTELRRALEVATQAAQQVAPTLRKNFGRANYQTKHNNERDWVTKWDSWAETQIRTVLNTFDPSVGIVGEEAGGQMPKRFWTIDPIDGTSHFVRGNPFCMTMIALVDHGTPVVSVLYDFVRNHIYHASAAGGAYLNGQKLQVSERPLPLSYLEIYTDEATDRGRALQRRVEATGAYLLRWAATGATFAAIARGAMEGFIIVDNPYASLWDVAPGTLLVHEAGGSVRTAQSDSFDLHSPDFIASNQHIADQLQAIVVA